MRSTHNKKTTRGARSNQQTPFFCTGEFLDVRKWPMKSSRSGSTGSNEGGSGRSITDPSKVWGRHPCSYSDNLYGLSWTICGAEGRPTGRRFLSLYPKRIVPLPLSIPLPADCSPFLLLTRTEISSLGQGPALSLFFVFFRSHCHTLLALLDNDPMTLD